MSTTPPEQLSFSFRGRQVPVTWSAAVTPKQAEMTLQSKPFRKWVHRIETSVTNHPGEPHRQVNIESVELQSVDIFGARGVGFAKIKSHCTLQLEENSNQTSESTTIHLPGICLLRGDAVAILVALFCTDDGSVHSLLTEQPR